MNKAELVNAVAEKTGFTKKDSEKAIEASTTIISNELARGGKVHLVGFGSFEVTARAARKGRNPKTGEELEIMASIAPKFKPSAALKELVNQ